MQIKQTLEVVLLRLTLLNREFANWISGGSKFEGLDEFDDRLLLDIGISRSEIEGSKMRKRSPHAANNVVITKELDNDPLF